MRYGGIRQFIPKTANYAIKADFDRNGTVFTTRGAGGAVTFTLPTLNAAKAGVFFDFHNIADQTMTVAAAAGKAVCVNNAAATSLAASTGGQKIGARIRAEWDGTSWLLAGQNVGITYTVA